MMPRQPGGRNSAGLKSRQAAFNGGSATLDAHMFSPFGTLSQSGILGTTTTRDMTALRLETSFAYSDPDSLITFVTDFERSIPQEIISLVWLKSL